VSNRGAGQLNFLNREREEREGRSRTRQKGSLPLVNLKREKKGKKKKEKGGNQKMMSMATCVEYLFLRHFQQKRKASAAHLRNHQEGRKDNTFGRHGGRGKRRGPFPDQRHYPKSLLLHIATMTSESAWE